MQFSPSVKGMAYLYSQNRETRLWNALECYSIGDSVGDPETIAEAEKILNFRISECPAEDHNLP